MPVLTGPPLVSLRNASAYPYDGAISAARTCYAPRVVGPDEVTASQRESIGPLTFEAGHHTVWQHAHFEFGLESISRQLVWTFLHAHPFYNSEPSSQRFVRLDEIKAHVPEGLSPEAREVYNGAIEDAWESYRKLTELLKGDTQRILSDVRHLTDKASEKRQKKVRREAEKKAIEIARYVIPVECQECQPSRASHERTALRHRAAPVPMCPWVPVDLANAAGPVSVPGARPSWHPESRVADDPPHPVHDGSFDPFSRAGPTATIPLEAAKSADATPREAGPCRALSESGSRYSSSWRWRPSARAPTSRRASATD